MMPKAELLTESGFGAISRITLATIIFAVTILTALTAQAQTYTVLYNFSGGATGENGTPYVIDGAGNLYGSANGGSVGNECPSRGCGVVFKLTHTNSGWTESILYRFQGGTDGAVPGPLVRGPDGNLYGTTNQGGGTGCFFESGCGTVFKLTPPPTVCRSVSCPWIETILYRFSGNNDSYPMGALVFDQNGNIYGTTTSFGEGFCPGIGCGEVYELTPSNGGWSQTVLYTFLGGSGGSNPPAGVIFDAAGNLYGSVSFVSEIGYGGIFQLANTGSGWTENVLYAFQAQNDGSSPDGGLILDRRGSGCLIGTTYYGPFQGQGGSGTIFSLCPSNGSWNFNTTYVFQPPNFNGPYAPLVQDAAFNLYGTWEKSAFELGQSGYLDLHDFTGGDNGSNSRGLIPDDRGNFYGGAYGGSGQNCLGSCGLIYEITP